MADKKISQETAKVAADVDLAQDYVRAARGAASNYKIKLSEVAKLSQPKNLVVAVADFTGTDYTPTGVYSLAGPDARAIGRKGGHRSAGLAGWTTGRALVCGNATASRRVQGVVPRLASGGEEGIGDWLVWRF